MKNKLKPYRLRCGADADDKWDAGTELMEISYNGRSEESSKEESLLSWSSFIV